MHKVSIDFALQSFQAFVRVEKVSVISKHVKIKKIRAICNVIYIDKKQVRPKTDPCGTSHEMGLLSDTMLPIDTKCSLLYR